ncbi:MAG: 4Fe-4S dicluster domain-containing protein [Candidatus Krumholzibacteriota bacterium]|nr:4Fe-4S dicluster domain-containing protein [Candidatus Krumholzibacteriota bacterium]
MSVRVNPDLREELMGFGGDDVSACMNCGNCTAICPLSKDSTVFPRKAIRYMQLGMKDHLFRSPEPWLCYYCGECSDTCPRDANPGETMMAARRYLTSLYDWTGLSKRLYLSAAWELGLLLFVALIVGALFLFLHGPLVRDHVELTTFAPTAWVELGDWILAAMLSFFLLTNAYRMSRAILGGEKVPLSLGLREFKTLLIHGVTQKRWQECESPTRWLKHLLLVTAYATMLLMVVVFLRWFQTDEIRSIWHPTRLLGYYATAILLYVTADAMISRLRKREQIHKHSDLTDWMFLILLFLTTLTGIFVHAFRLADWPMPTYIIYVIHLMIAVPMLVIEVPFGKWAHLLYRPLAVYLTTVRDKMKAAPAGTQASAG